MSNNNDGNVSEENENYLSNALKELLQKFSSIKNPGGEDEHLQECIQSWLSQHRKYTKIQVIEQLERIAHKNNDYACLLGFFYHKPFVPKWVTNWECVIWQVYFYMVWGRILTSIRL
ncbi:2019_t:CDS:2 [Ambispora leptoticha]|uniref:2019_t:CDS:1 n=1 Tax=Ambispora leptoticha TaxID=144679 RepID=A0A9N9DDW7_9GLOM|nr:2019_t:CDS:2 [Ambispora leptoticha]